MMEERAKPTYSSVTLFAKFLGWFARTASTSSPRPTKTLKRKGTTSEPTLSAVEQGA